MDVDDHSFAAEVRQRLGFPAKFETVAAHSAGNDEALVRLDECVDLATGGTLPATPASTLAAPEIPEAGSNRGMLESETRVRPSELPQAGDEPA